MKSFLAALLVGFSLTSAAGAAPAGQPNILWLTCEDIGPDLGAYGNPYCTTPHLDRLAHRGIIYLNAWSTAPVCAPARTTIISGLYPPSTGSEHMRSMVPLASFLKMYPQYLREAGYYCTNNSKEDYNLRKPKDLWDESSRKAHWKNRASGQPFFAIFNYTVSHESQIRKRPHKQVHDPLKVQIPSFHPDTPEVRLDWAQYHDKITEMDAQAGRSLRELEDAGLMDDTIIFFYGDHGAGMPRFKRWPYNSGLRVPLIVYVPEKFKDLAPAEYRPGGKSDRLVGFVDLAPTLLSIAGIKPPAAMQGYAFMGKYEAPPQPYIYGFRGRMDERYDMVRVVRDKRFIYIRNYMPHEIYGQYIAYMFQTPTTRIWKKLYDEGKLSPPQTFFWERKPPEELYDLQNDPDEVHNLAASRDHREILERLRKAQRDLVFKIRDVGFLPEGEIHSRSQGSTPYEMGHDEAKYPLKKIFAAADLASSLAPDALAELKKALADGDSAVRYWGAMGILMRERPSVRASLEELRGLLKDGSPYVRVTAAEALGRFGEPSDLETVLSLLIGHASADTNDVFTAMMALNAIDALGDKAAPLLPAIRKLPRRARSAPPRTGGYVGRLVDDILLKFPSAEKPRTDRKKKRKTVARWDIFDLRLEGPSSANPFLDVSLSARFTRSGKSGEHGIEAEGFYDGNGIYHVRFMPPDPGTWRYETRSNRPELDGKKGSFRVVKPEAGNHGPLHVSKTYHFAYADGTPYFEVGTTCYAWVHQTEKLQEQTLKTLAGAPFNKIRFCVFPKSYSYNKNEPPFFAFERKPDGKFDFTRFNPVFWRHFEKRIRDLAELGIEADIILFHPYDRWGFSRMDRKTDDRYLRYTVARLAAFHNVWWSFANEYDLMRSKRMEDWDRFFQIVQARDPYHHLRGIHNCRGFYDHTKPWVTHASIQRHDLPKVFDWRKEFHKPIVIDECGYEGNIPQGWGKLSPEQMLRRFWIGTVRGGYVGHGETYQHPRDILWWSKGGVLHGKSPSRIAFLKKIVTAMPFQDMTPSEELSPGTYMLSRPGECALVYFTQPSKAVIPLSGNRAYKVDGIDTWNMTVAALASADPGKFTFTAPKADYALRITAYRPGEKQRPAVHARAEPSEGIAPLAVSFRGNTALEVLWDFGDGTTSHKRDPEHVYAKPGLYAATVTVTDRDGLSSSGVVPIAVDRDTSDPLVRAGFPGGETPGIRVHGAVKRSSDGTFDLRAGEPVKWISVGKGPLQRLEGLRSFTILGWVNPESLEIGKGGNRIVFNLNYNHSGIDLVHLRDGRLRLAVNEWPDEVHNDSAPGKLVTGRWTFFAVTYDATRTEDNVRWFFGEAGRPARLDRKTTYRAGPTGTGSGPLTIGNYNETIHRHGKDRQVRGRIRGVQIFGSRVGSRGALSIEAIRKCQTQS